MGTTYFDLASSIKRKPTHVFLLPWLARGGADLGAIMHVRAVAEDPNLHPLVITTEPARSPWLGKLPPRTTVIELGCRAQGLDSHAQLIILSRLLLQCAPATIHLINSALGWHAFARHGKAISSLNTLYASVYCDEFDEDGYRCGYAANDLQEVHRHLNGIVTDNARFADDLQLRFGIDRRKMHTVYFPTLLDSLKPQKEVEKRFLWAGRLARQKRPDILLRIASILPDVEFDVYGEFASGVDPDLVAGLQSAANVNLLGPYDNFQSLPLQRLAGLLYTSSWDGLPNVILEAAASGLPIVAPRSVGGIGEVVSNETGYPVNGEEADLYVDAIRAVLLNREESLKRASSAQKLVASRHSWSSFVASLSKLPDYGIVQASREAVGERDLDARGVRDQFAENSSST